MVFALLHQNDINITLYAG